MYIVLSAILGACIGSFLNVVSLRLPKGEQLGGRSHCPQCGANIRWYQNIPLASFVILRGRCASCHKSISWQYPAVEAVTAILFALTYVLYASTGDWLTAATMMTIVSFAVALFVTDVRFGVLPDQLTLGGAMVIGLLNIARGMDWWNLCLSALAAALFFWVQRLVSHGKWVGDGDIRMGLWLGAALGWPGILVALFISYLTGALVGLSLIVTSKAKWNSQVPFGTFLAVAAVFTFVYGETLTGMYLTFVGL